MAPGDGDQNKGKKRKKDEKSSKNHRNNLSRVGSDPPCGAHQLPGI